MGSFHSSKERTEIKIIKIILRTDTFLLSKDILTILSANIFTSSDPDGLVQDDQMVSSVAASPHIIRVFGFGFSLVWFWFGLVLVC